MNIEQFVNLMVEHHDDQCIGSEMTEMVNDGDDEIESFKMESR